MRSVLLLLSSLLSFWLLLAEFVPCDGGGVLVQQHVLPPCGDDDDTNGNKAPDGSCVQSPEKRTDANDNVHAPAVEDFVAADEPVETPSEEVGDVELGDFEDTGDDVFDESDAEGEESDGDGEESDGDDEEYDEDEEEYDEDDEDDEEYDDDEEGYDEVEEEYDEEEEFDPDDAEADEFDDAEADTVAPGEEGESILVLDVAGADLGVPQLMDGDEADDVMDLIDKARNYFEDFVKIDDAYAPVRTICKNKHELCGLWAFLGECESNPEYMRSNCAPMCQSCEQMHMETRCPLDPNAPLAWQPGDLNKMFERITTDPEIEQYEPIVLSRPSYVNGDTKESANYQLGPWVVLLDNFLTEEECDRLIYWGAEEGYEASSDVGDQRPDGTYEESFDGGRTSTNSWCQTNCYEDEITQQVLMKMYHVTQIDDNFSEYLQMLKYEVGQFYNTHHDYIPGQKARIQGVRILTLFLYLNDVEEGGGTDFPTLNMTVAPKRGRALLWPSVYDEAPHNMDTRTHHQALPVTKGKKYGANAWYHQRDFKTNHARGCE